MTGTLQDTHSPARRGALDVCLLGSDRGADQLLTSLSRLRRRGSPPLLLLVPAHDHLSLHRLLRSGALGIAERDSGARSLAQAIRTVTSGGWSLPAPWARTVVTGFLRSNEQPHTNSALRQVQEKLTPRQQEVLTLVGKGLTNPEIAKALAVGPATVKDHVQTILDRLGTPNRTLAARLAWEAQLLN
ncbi:response regulator transcription factor [Streptomyces sp. NPDC091292]|uniref:response regulator transcription factor n=1 Tax=Streptomyces sp. NPDC091292 TaxID=3365991 RepID=UPI0037FB0CA1